MTLWSETILNLAAGTSLHQLLDMRILVTGACGFVGSHILRCFRRSLTNATLVGIDNFCRAGSEINRRSLKDIGVQLIHGDVRASSDFETLPAVDWVIDAAANPSVLAGVDGRTSSRQLVEHNLGGTINMLEFCRRHGAGFILLSTSRVYSISALTSIPLQVTGSRFTLDLGAAAPAGVSREGVAENFSTTPPLSLYGVSKKASEDLALEYAHAFKIPVWINRCGVMAGAGQFGRPDQGILAYWLHSWRERRPLKYLGFNGTGHQVRDALHPSDLAELLLKQMKAPASGRSTLANVSGGLESSFSLAELSAWCRDRFGQDLAVEHSGETRAFDIPWLILDDSKTRSAWDWQPVCTLEQILLEIAAFADSEPEWMQISAAH